MSRLLLVSLGQLNVAVLEAAARDGRFPHIIVATRDVAHARARANAARIGAAIEGQYPRIEVVSFDLNAANAGDVLRKIQPDLMFAAPTLMPARRIAASANARARALPFGGWLACHLAPMLLLRDAWDRSGLRAPWVAASYPDVVNPILHMTGSGPVSGAGQVGECVPKIQFLASQHAGAPVQEVSVRLVGGHALSALFYSDEAVRELPPFLLQVLWHGHDISLAVKDRLRSVRMPVIEDMQAGRITASAAIEVLAALLGEQPHRLHVPAPNGLVGGYPASASRKGVDLDLPPEWSLEQALGVNAAALPFDGIAAIEKDGSVVFSDRTAALLRALTGEDWPRLRPDDAARMAVQLVSAVAGH